MATDQDLVANKEGKTPKVSVCIPTRNCAQFLEQAVSSALGQDYRDLEVVIVDNCSTDNTESLVREMSLHDGRIRYYRNDRDLGLIGNLNKCLEYARGEYIKYVLSDDMLLPGCLDEMTRCLDAHPSVALVTVGRLITDEHGKPLSLRRYSAKPGIVPGREAIQKCLFGKNYIGEPTAVMFRRRDAARGFRPDLVQLTDMEMWFHLLERGSLFNVPESLCAIRWHTGQLTNVNVKSGAMVEDNVTLFEEYRDKPYVTHTWFRKLQHKLRIGYRVWMSRRHMPAERRCFVIKRYSSRILYYSLMPVVSAALRLARMVQSVLVQLLYRSPPADAADLRNQNVRR